MRVKKILYRLDVLFLALIVCVITLQPYFMHGAINFYEIGQYLPQINEVFHGKVLYREMFIMRGPLEILMPWFMMSILGKHIAVLSAYFYFGTVLTLIIYAVFALTIFRTRGFTYLFTLTLIARTFPWSCFNVWGGIRFSFGILAILVAANFLKRKNRSWLFFAGIVSGIALWTSFEIGVISFVSVAAMLCLYGYSGKENIKAILRYEAIYVIGCITASIPFMGYLVFNNALAPYINAVEVVLNKMINVFNPLLCYDAPMNFREFLLAFSPLNHNFRYTLPFFFYAAAGIYLLKGFVKKKITSIDICVAAVFIYGILLYKSSFRNIEGPSYRMAFQPLLLIMFFYLERIYGYARSMKSTLGIKKVLAIFLILAVPLYSILFSVTKYNKRFFIFKEIKSLAANGRHADIPYASPQPTGLTSKRAQGIIVPMAQAEEIDNVVAYIASHTKEREIVFTFPDLGTYNFLTDRPPMGRFYTAEFSFMDERWFNELMMNLEHDKPRYVICARDFSRSAPFRPTIGVYVDKVMRFLDEHYEIVESFKMVNILRRKI